jgi:hypothetical protein
MSGINIVASLKEQQETLKRLLEALQSGKTWTSEKPGRATVEEIVEQIGRIKVLLAELEKLLRPAS